jgi:hypothetical protein
VVALHIISELFTSQGFFGVLQVSARSVEGAAEVGGGFCPGFIKEENSTACASRRGTGCPEMSFAGGTKSRE